MKCFSYETALERVLKSYDEMNIVDYSHVHQGSSHGHQAAHMDIKQLTWTSRLGGDS